MLWRVPAKQRQQGQLQGLSRCTVENPREYQIKIDSGEQDIARRKPSYPGPSRLTDMNCKPMPKSSQKNVNTITAKLPDIKEVLMISNQVVSRDLDLEAYVVVGISSGCERQPQLPTKRYQLKLDHGKKKANFLVPVSGRASWRTASSPSSPSVEVLARIEAPIEFFSSMLSKIPWPRIKMSAASGRL